MSSILKSEYSKSVCEFGVTNETHKSNKIKVYRYDNTAAAAERVT